MRTSPSRDRSAAADPAASPTSTDPARRRFLLGAGSAGAAAAMTVLPAAATAHVAAPAAPAEDDTVAKYRETQHVRDYYRTIRL
jgi:hypothetical protein